MIKKLIDTYIRFFIWILIKSGKVEWTTQLNRRRIINRTLVLVDEAKKRGLKIENLTIKDSFLKKGFKHLRFFRVKLHGKYYFFESIPLGQSYQKMNIDNVSNKWFVKKILQKAKVSTPDGRIISSLKQVLDYIKIKDFPVVVKPINKSLCMGVTIDIKNVKELEDAINYVKKYGKKFLIEKFLRGLNYRLTVVDGRMVAAIERKRPYIIGDGKHTVQQLINIKNKDPRRNTREDFTLHPIKIDRFTKNLLFDQGLTLDLTPKKNQKVILSKKINLRSGADTFDATQKVHSKIAKIAVKIAQKFDAKVLGLDILAVDISKAPSKDNEIVIIEVNPFPYIDMHHYPLEGKSRNVAAAIWDMIFKEIGFQKEEVKN
jgi:cyanophycin synthetase